MIGNKGFTLIEVLIVVVIMGILVAIATPQVVGWIRNAQYKEAAQTALSALRQAKGKAINLNQQVSATFNLDDSAANDNNTIVILPSPPPNTFTLKSGVEIKWGTDANLDCNDVDDGPVSFTFFPNGTFNSTELGYICIFDDTTRKYRVGITSANTGRILLQKWNGSTWQAMP